jgi:hypothetical protein
MRDAAPEEPAGEVGRSFVGVEKSTSGGVDAVGCNKNV